MISARISDFSEIQKEIDRKVARVPAAVAREAGNIIRDNSAAGKDIKGERLSGYSKGYESFRAKHGLTTDPADLRVTGQLLDNQIGRVNGMKSSIQPSASDRQIAEGISKIRKFYPETDADILPYFEERLVKAAERALEE